MIIGIGTDIVQIPRIESMLVKHGDKFEERVFSVQEIKQSQKFTGDKAERMRASFLAKRFAAKEAFVKALGSGFRGGITMQEITVCNDSQGKPFFSLKGKAEKALSALGGQNKHIISHLSLSDDYPTAMAYVVLSCCGEL